VLLTTLPAALGMGNAATLLCLPTLGRRRPCYGNRFGLPASSPISTTAPKTERPPWVPPDGLLSLSCTNKVQAIGEEPSHLGGSSRICSGILLLI
jgi:hypothetical protein